jgi:hypothetical protein
MAKIIVCWNNNAFAEELKKKQGEDIFVCTKMEDLKKHIIKNANLFVVLCELEWDHTSSGYLLREFRGVSLVQQYIRAELGLKTPVVFVSFLAPEKLVKFKEDTDIVMTPALQHAFLQLPAGNPTIFLRDLYDYLPSSTNDKAMKEMNDRDLAYTRMFYCDLNGMLRRIHHAINNINEVNESVEDYRKKYKDQIKQIKYIIEHHFLADKNELVDELSKQNDLHTFCQKLLDNWDSKQTDTSVSNTVRSKLKILYFEDSVDDEKVIRFKKFCEKNSKHFNLEIISDLEKIPDIIDSITDYECDVILCDIELRDKRGFLHYLGYDLVKEMAKKDRTPLFYIVTNMSRSVYDQIKPDIVKRIMLKSEAFGSDALIEKFLYGIKELLDDRKVKQEESNETQNIFNYFYDYVKRGKGFPITLSFFNINEDQAEKEEKLRNFKELNAFVNNKALEMYAYFKKLFEEEQHNEKGDNTCVFLTYNKCCKVFRDKIEKTGQRGGRNFRKQLDMTMNPSTKDLVRFVKILIFRRFFLCIKHFVNSNNIQNSFNDYRKTLTLNIKGLQTEKSRSFTENDLAYRAIGEQFKSLNKHCYRHISNTDFILGKEGTDVTKEKEKKKKKEKREGKEFEIGYRKQSRLDATLLWKNQKELSLKDEEKDFKDKIK